MTLTVTVNQQQINDGESGCMTCPVALALAEALPGFWEVSTTTAHCWKYRGRRRLLWTAELPVAVQTWIWDYDIAEQPVSPFSFRLDLKEGSY